MTGQHDELRVGDVVRFREEVDHGDLDYRFQIVERNGSRVRIRTLDWKHGAIAPEKVVPTVDVVKVNE